MWQESVQVRREDYAGGRWMAGSMRTKQENTSVIKHGFLVKFLVLASWAGGPVQGVVYMVLIHSMGQQETSHPSYTLWLIRAVDYVAGVPVQGVVPLDRHGVQVRREDYAGGRDHHPRLALRRDFHRHQGSVTIG
jgi:hypothetical protein